MSKHRAGRLRPRHARRARRRVSGPLVAVFLGVSSVLGGTTTLTPAAANISVYQGSPAMAPTLYQRRVKFWINRVRREHDLARLHFARCTDRVADRWSKHLALKEQFYHQHLMRILVKCNAYYAGETLGRGSITPHRLVYLWMHSPEHRAVLLSPHARRIGIGSYPDRYGRWVTAADFMHF